MPDWFGAGKKKKEAEERLRNEAAPVDAEQRKQELLKETVEDNEGLVGNAARSFNKRKKMLEDL